MVSEIRQDYWFGPQNPPTIADKLLFLVLLSYIFFKLSEAKYSHFFNNLRRQSFFFKRLQAPGCLKTCVCELTLKFSLINIFSKVLAALRLTDTGIQYDQQLQPAMRAYFQLLRRALAEAGLFLPFERKKRAFHAVCAYIAPFFCSVVPSITFSSNLSNFENNSKNKIK